MDSILSTTADEPTQPLWLQRLPSLYLPFILLIVAAFAWRPLEGGDDFWAHAAIGRWIVEHGQMPQETLFLWSEKQRWLPHAWLTQVFFSYLMRLGGEQGGPYLALVVTVICSAFPWFLVYKIWRGQSRPHVLMVPLFLIAIWVSSPRFDPRPELFTACLLALLYVFLLDLNHRRTYSWPLASCVLAMFALWPNLHGAVAYGLVILWATVFCDFLQPVITSYTGHREEKENAARHFRAITLPFLTTALGATLLVFVANPHGFEYWRVLVPVQSETFKKIDEWKPFWVWPQMEASVTICELVLWVLALVLWIKSRNKRLAQLAWLIILGGFLIMARRNLWLTALTSLFVIAANSGPLDTERLFAGWRALSAKLDPNSPTGSDIPIPMRMIARGGIMALLFIGIAQALPTGVAPFSAVSPKLPVKRAQFIETQTKGRLLNDYESSAYLEWYFHDRRKLYIDLNNVYPDSLMAEYFVFTGGTPQLFEILDRRKIQVVSLRPPKKIEGMLNTTKRLNNSPEWKAVYKGKDGTVWVRAKRQPS